MTDLLAFFIAWCTLAGLAGAVLGYLGYRANRHKDNAAASDQDSRHTASTITDDALEALYQRIDLLTARLESQSDRDYLDALLSSGPETTVQLLGRGLWKERDRAINAEQRAEQAEAAISRVRAAHYELVGRCAWCLVSWPCPDVCRLDGPPGCRNCGEYHLPITERPRSAE